MLIGLVELSAQNIINGKVTDKKGNPLPGVKIDIHGTDDSVYSNVDGTFEIDASLSRSATFNYGGMNQKRTKIKPDMVVKMGKGNKNRELLGNHYLIGFSLSGDNLAPGFMFAYGGMIKGYFRFQHYSPIADFKFEPNLQYSFNSGNTYTSGSLGAMLRLKSPFYVYAGVGITSSRLYYYNEEDGVYFFPDRKKESEFDYTELYEIYNEQYFSKGILLDFGFMMSFKRIYANLGIAVNVRNRDNDLFLSGAHVKRKTTLNPVIGIGIIL